MPAHWQDWVAALAALAALAWYVRRLRRSRGAACEGCPVKPTSGFVPVSSLRAPEAARGDHPRQF
jgi:hypothetical protein